MWKEEGNGATAEEAEVRSENWWYRKELELLHFLAFLQLLVVVIHI